MMPFDGIEPDEVVLLPNGILVIFISTVKYPHLRSADAMYNGMSEYMEKYETMMEWEVEFIDPHAVVRIAGFINRNPTFYRAEQA